MNPVEIKKLIQENNVPELVKLINSNVLKVSNGKIMFADPAYAKSQEEYWDKRQLVRKLNLNSLYGAILQAGCRFFDKRIGQSTTLTGRQIAKHMASTVNEMITGKPDYIGDAIIYGDSVIGSTEIRTDSGIQTIESMFNSCSSITTSHGKEYGCTSSKVAGFDPATKQMVMSQPQYVMRHKTKKKLYKITTENGKSVTVTEDHSVMVYRDNNLIEVTPSDLLPTDVTVTINYS